MSFIAVNMFKRHIDEFSKNLKISDFYKCEESLPLEKIRMFDVFPSREGPFDDTRSKFQFMLCFIKFFYSKKLIFAFLLQNRV